MTALPESPCAPAQLLWLGDEAAHDPTCVGGKAASLSRLALSFNVPKGFVLAFGSARAVPDHDELAAAYARLGELVGEREPAVAVRSSAVDEDGADASFAGIHESYLGVRGVEEMVRAVGCCRDSFASERALEYRRRLRGLSAVPERTAVLVQWLVPADVSGVAFGANPVTGRRNEIVINASWGLGESIVGGTVTPDTWVVRRAGLEPAQAVVADKRRMTVALPGGSTEVNVPARLARAPALHSDQARAAAALAVRLEQETGWPVDVEFAFGRGQLFLLQCRPITTLRGNDPR